jgi:pimeloyl-ACP methyl ester carboxylesterase
MATFDSDGVSIHYEEFGSGPPIVLVHGFASNLQDNWELTGWVRKLVSAGRRVIALDCRGHGDSGKPHDPMAYSEGTMSGDVIRLMDHLEIERADLMGYSMGGAIALDLILHKPRRFRRAVLGGVGALLRGVTESTAIADALSTDDPSTISSPVARAFRDFAEQRGNDLKALAACIRRGRARPDAQTLASICMPVLVVVGEKDDLVSGADQLAAAIPGARLITVPVRDHITVVADSRFKEPVLAFIRWESADLEE